MFYFSYATVDINSGYDQFGWLTIGLKNKRYFCGIVLQWYICFSPMSYIQT